MNTARLLAAILLSALVGTSVTDTAAGQERLAPETAGRLAQLVEGSGYRSAKVSDTSWKFAFKGHNKDSIDVFVAANVERVELKAVVAYKKEIADRAEAALRLLKYNATSATGAVSVTEDEDFVILDYYEPNSLSMEVFKGALQVAAIGADDAFRVVKSLAPVDGGKPPQRPRNGADSER